jgi:hypothetical protein
MIPDAIVVYRFIEAKFGIIFAGRIPLVLVLICGAAYAVYIRQSRIRLQNLLYLIPCAIIVLIIFTSVSNPNKHIHIPEYIVLSWLVYAALSRDYKGKGLLVLVFICTSMLGVADELEQGIHPGRSYGSSDMLVNTASALIGVFTILGLSQRKPTGGQWLNDLKMFSGLLGLTGFGLCGAVLMCINLFVVQAYAGAFWGIYPAWLVIWSVTFVINTPLFVYLYKNTLQRHSLFLEKDAISIEVPKMITAQLWIYSPLGILFYMHILLIYVSISGVIFK